MSTNYFNAPTYRPTSTVNPYAINFNPTPTADTSQLDATYGAMTDQPGYARRAQLLGELGTGPGSIAARYADLMQARQTRIAAAMRGYGGVSFRQDDPNTPENESLSPVYESGQMGQNERDAAKQAQAAAATRGIQYSSGGEQLIGAALQRVSNEARQMIDQYAGDLNQLATGQLTDQTNALNQYTSLYGTDAASMIDTRQAAADAAGSQEPTVQRFDTKPNVDTNQYNVVQGGDGAYYTLRIADFPTAAGTYNHEPIRKTLDGRFGPGNYVVVKVGNKWEVRTK